MKQKKDPSYYAYNVLSIVLGMAVAVTIYMIIAPLILSMLYSTLNDGASVKVALSNNAGKSYLEAQGNKYTLLGFEGTLLVKNPNGMISIMGYLAPLWFFIPITYGVYLLRKIIKNVYLKNHFAAENVKNIRIIALVVILIPHIHAIYQNIIYNSIQKNLLIDTWRIEKKLPGLINIFYVSVLPEYIFYGFLIFIFSYVFVQGKKLQEENDLTV
jgi:hypothetical protein